MNDIERDCDTFIKAVIGGIVLLIIISGGLTIVSQLVIYWRG